MGLIFTVQPRIAEDDDTFEGYYIPKGTAIWANTFAMSQDPKVYPQPETFRPERFLTAEGQFTRRNELPVFGYGRRYVCMSMIK